MRECIFGYIEKLSFRRERKTTNKSANKLERKFTHFMLSAYWIEQLFNIHSNIIRFNRSWLWTIDQMSRKKCVFQASNHTICISLRRLSRVFLKHPFDLFIEFVEHRAKRHIFLLDFYASPFIFFMLIARICDDETPNAIFYHKYQKKKIWWIENGRLTISNILRCKAVKFT